ncbi:MAG: DUF975 family protein [Lachnospiraceae bacterium]|nr:DUF975 family protein [Lachnospiraceae bacterium]
MNPYLSSSGLKALARGQLIGHYGTVAGAYFIHMLCITPLTFAVTSLFAANTLMNLVLSTIASFLISLVSGLFIAGEAYMYLKIACNRPVTIGDLFYGFQHENQKVITLQAVIAGISVLTSLPASAVGFLSTMNPENNTLNNIYIFLFVLGLVIDLIISLMLSQAFFLMLDFPNYTPKQLLTKSIQLMKKNKWRLFRVQISFVPLVLLGYLSCGVGLLWVQPYMMATEANFYLDLIKKKQTV